MARLARVVIPGIPHQGTGTSSGSRTIDASEMETSFALAHFPELVEPSAAKLVERFPY
jgi:hypothetical protein